MKSSSLNASEASSITLNLVGFIASDDDRLERFLNLSGISLEDLRSGAANPAFQGFVLDYALQDEKLIVDFSVNAGIKADLIQMARFALPGASHDL